MVILMAKQTSLNRILDNITTDIRKRTKAALEYAGQKISGDFAVMAYLALDNYYREYDPDYYKRTYQLMNDSYYKVNQRNGFFVNAGIIFNPELMNHPHKGIPEEGIMENFMYGIHGSPDVYDSGVNYRDQMDNFYKQYNESGLPYHYFQEYMNKH